MKKHLLFVLLICFSMLAACGNTSEDSSTSSEDMADIAVEDNDATGEIAKFGTEKNGKDSKQQETESQEDDQTTEKKDLSSVDRKMIYTANLQIEVKEYQKTYDAIESQVEKLDGYIVESNMYEDEESGSKNGQITARVPQEKFREFIQLVEDGSSKVLESSTSGQDVTEEYVDLESRLKSKQVVEKRLLTFMEDANKTEDLLKISSDLGEVQEKIEEITGQMKYLENKSDLATVSIYIQEKNVKISGTGKDDLNTWEQTKQQFMKSINFIITALSGVFVFFVGNLPILILIGIIVITVFFIVRKSMKRKEKE